MSEELTCNIDDVIIIADQETLIKSLIKNLAILRGEVYHCILIGNEYEAYFYNFKRIADSLKTKIKALIDLAERLDCKRSNVVTEFVNRINLSWLKILKKVSEENSTFFVASRTMHGISLTTVLAEIKKEIPAIALSLKFGEFVYDRQHVINGYIYYNEMMELLYNLDGYDEKVQQYLIMKNIIKHVEELNLLTDKFASQTNLLPNKSINDTQLMDCQVFTTVSKLLTGELLGLCSIDPAEALMY